MSDPGFPYFDTDDFFQFPKPRSATPEGIVATGGNLSPGMLLSAYSQGIFPWFSPGDPILWWSPDPRCLLEPGNVHVSRSMRKLLKQGTFSFTMDRRFSEVISHCSMAYRPGQDGTWITPDMIDAYTELHEKGFAHSVEVWEDSSLCGGLYGLSLGGMFFGESMFSLQPNASKGAFIILSRFTAKQGFDYIDCQLPTPHLESLGAVAVSREFYLAKLTESLQKKTLSGTWSDLFEISLSSNGC